MHPSQASLQRIAVTGASGQLGSQVLSLLAGRIPAARLIACVRDPQQADALAQQGIEIRRVDFTDAATLPGAFAGAGRVLIVSVNKLGEEARRMHYAAVDGAVRAGAQHVLYTSHMGARADSPFAPAADHEATERHLAATGVAHTALRHGFYAESALHMIGEGLKAGVLRVPEDGPVSWTARVDLAEADAVLLTGAGRFEGASPALTASEALTMAEIAAVAAALTGRDIRYTTISDGDWMEEAVRSGTPEFMARMLLGFYQAARRGDFAAVDPALERLIGRRPKTMQEVLAGYLNDSAG